jgi:hypothetical protein
LLSNSSARCAARPRYPASGIDAPFQLRPGLIVEILAFYDELRRRDRTLDDFERLMTGTLDPSADTDRGAERMLRQTRFLAAALGEFERRVAECGRVDEHGLRSLLLARVCTPAYRHIVVTVADQAADSLGLWPADFDLLSRMPGLERLDIIATESLLASGFHERIHGLLPGIEEARVGSLARLPVLAAPEPPTGEEPVRWFVYRDREEELVAVARNLASETTAPAGEAAVVFQRPLPYLYLARQVFADAHLPYHALDSLPLAAEPFVAALDLLFTFVVAEGTRAATVPLLRSPHWSFRDAGRLISPAEVSAADELLQDISITAASSGWLRWLLRRTFARATRVTGKRRASLWTRGAAALRAANDAATELRAVVEPATASGQIAALLAFILAHEQLPSTADPWYARHLRARAAVLSALEALLDAHARHDDEPLTIAELASSARRWIEGQTFSPRTGTDGVRLLDAPAAAYTDVDDLRLLGLVQSDWPERSRRSIFIQRRCCHSSAGRPIQSAWLPPARFRDLLILPTARVSLSTFTLEDDSIVPASAFLDDVEAAALPVERVDPAADVRVFTHEALAEDGRRLGRSRRRG